MVKFKVNYTPSDITNTRTLHDNAATVQFLSNELTESAKIAALVASESWQRVVECVAQTRGLEGKDAKAFVDTWSPDNVGINLGDDAVAGKRVRQERVELTPTGRVKKKRVVDPNMPKKPMTVFLAFSTKKRAEIREARIARGEPPLQNSEMANEVAELWSKLSDAEKEPYQQEYQKKLIEYHDKKNSYIKDKAANVAAAALATENAEEDGEEEAESEEEEQEAQAENADSEASADSDDEDSDDSDSDDEDSDDEDSDEEEEEADPVPEPEPEPYVTPKKSKTPKEKKAKTPSKASKK